MGSAASATDDGTSGNIFLIDIDLFQKSKYAIDFLRRMIKCEEPVRKCDKM